MGRPRWWILGPLVATLLACGEDGASGSGTGGDGGAGGGGGSGGSGAQATGGTSTGGSAGGGATGGAGGSPGGGGTGGVVGGGGSGGASGGGGTGGACIDTCPAPNGGVTWQCRKRFLYGINYAWKEFAGDFGGISAWGIDGVAAASQAHAQNLADMRAHGVSVVRWWIFPDFRGDGVAFDGSETPTGLAGTAVADLQKALELAEQADVFLMLTVFSFDNFRPSEDVAGIWTPGITPMVTDAAKRQALMNNVVRPVAQTVAASPYAARVVAWDVINEPEWAMTGSDPYGDPAFEADATLAPVSFGQMETFVSETIGVLRAESSALVTVGGAAAKWAKAWTGVGVDFYQLHIYDWVDQWWPYSNPPSTYGLDKPIVMGELPATNLNGVPYATVVQSFWDTGYAGAMPWMYDGASAAELDAVKAFADAHACETHYTPSGTPDWVTANGGGPSRLTLPKRSLRRCAVIAGRPSCARAR